MADFLSELEFPSLSIADFSGSLDYIDRLPTAGFVGSRDVLLYGLSNRGRDAADISNSQRIVVNHKRELPRGNLVDNRRFNPQVDFDPGEMEPGAARLVDEWIPFVDPERPDRRYRVDTETGEIRYFPTVHRGGESRSRFRFSDPGLVALCFRRWLRRVMMFVSGKAGTFYRPRHFSAFSRVRC